MGGYSEDEVKNCRHSGVFKDYASACKIRLIRLLFFFFFFVAFDFFVGNVVLKSLVPVICLFSLGDASNGP